MTDADGNIAQHVEYIPYGEVFVEERNNSFSTNYLFNAKELDNETGLYYYGARYLDPTGAMWLSVDPMWEKYAGMSPYNYCAGNPVKMVDPDGREVEDDVDDFINDDSHLLIGKFNHDCTDVEYRESCLTDEFSPIKDATSVDFITYTGEIPIGDEYRNADGGYGGCTQATIKSAVDMFKIALDKEIRTVLDRQRKEEGRGGNIAMVVSQLKIDDYLNCKEYGADYRSSFIQMISTMKKDGYVYGACINGYYEKEKYGHNVIVTGITSYRRGRRTQITFGIMPLDIMVQLEQKMYLQYIDSLCLEK
ncbi:MAG: RHS repeat-associated core domain-containing protein [Paludibacteraceae bacterium]|nr:RHS repeat-associated core domain-containing protein [Paludibacteraceae bacterium]